MRHLQLALITALIGSTAACGWFASSSDDQIYVDPEEAEDPDVPKCKPKAVDTRGPVPWVLAEATPSGWIVSSIEADNREYVRIGFKKAALETKIEVAYNQEGPGDWATEAYRLMPAPEEEPPQELLLDAIKVLREVPADAAPFVQRAEGIPDPYDGLPPCP